MKIISHSPASHQIPLVGGRVAAGFPSPADDFIEKRLSLDDLLIKHPQATFFVEASGQSMTGAGIYPGDILIVDRSLAPVAGSIVIAIVDSDMTVKRLRFSSSGAPELHAENPNYPVIRFAHEAELKVWGVVTSIIKKVVG